jgi:hypothetical protein
MIAIVRYHAGEAESSAAFMRGHIWLICVWSKGAAALSLPRSFVLAKELSLCQGAISLPRSFVFAKELFLCQGALSLPRSYVFAKELCLGQAALYLPRSFVFAKELCPKADEAGFTK